MSRPIARRDFLSTSLAAGTLAAGAAIWPTAALAADVKADVKTEIKKPKLKKAVKIGMVKPGKTFEEKFTLLKSLGFDGCEFDSPSGADRDEAVKARDKTGIVIHGVVDSVHWNDRLSDPKEEVRAKGLAALQTALKDCKFYGGTTVLLVPGAVRDKDHENFEQVWERSQAEVRKAIPLAEELGVKIAIETVWNNFITTPEQLIKYVDEFKNPIVGGYFDISNMIKFGVSSADWIRQLGKRMLKFDFKGYHKERTWVPVGEGSEDWPEVLKACGEVGYEGWATAEIGALDEAGLKKLSETMNKLLELS